MTIYINRTTSEEDILYGQVQKVGRLYILQQLVIVLLFFSFISISGEFTCMMRKS